MGAADIDSYLDAVEEPKRGTLQAVRRAILAAIPEAEECISYGMPAFKVQGKVIAGFAAFTNHLSYLPHSGSVLPALETELAGLRGHQGIPAFPIDQPLPAELVDKLVSTRLQQLGF